jgi:hypothetical protein
VSFVPTGRTRIDDDAAVPYADQSLKSKANPLLTAEQTVNLTEFRLATFIIQPEIVPLNRALKKFAYRFSILQSVDHESQIAIPISQNASAIAN